VSAYNTLKSMASVWTRPMFDSEENIIEAPIIEMIFPYLAKDFQWINAKCIITSLSLDYGDTSRLAAARETGFGAAQKAPKKELLPAKIVVTISAAVVEETLDPRKNSPRYMAGAPASSQTSPPILPANGLLTPSAQALNLGTSTTDTPNPPDTPNLGTSTPD